MARKKRGAKSVVASTRGLKAPSIPRGAKNPVASTRGAKTSTRGTKRGGATRRGNTTVSTAEPEQEETTTTSDNKSEICSISETLEEVINTVNDSNDIQPEAIEQEPEEVPSATEDLGGVVDIQEVISVPAPQTVAANVTRPRTRFSRRKNQIQSGEEHKSDELNESLTASEECSDGNGVSSSPSIEHKKFRKFKNLLSTEETEDETQSDSQLVFEDEEEEEEVEAIDRSAVIIEEAIPEMVIIETASEVIVEADVEMEEENISEVIIESIPEILVEESVPVVEETVPAVEETVPAVKEAEAMKVDENPLSPVDQTNEAEISTQLSVLTVDSLEEDFAVMNYQSDSEKDNQEMHQIQSAMIEDIKTVETVVEEAEGELENRIAAMETDAEHCADEVKSLKKEEEEAVAVEANELADDVMERLQLTLEGDISTEPEEMEDRKETTIKEEQQTTAATKGVFATCEAESKITPEIVAKTETETVVAVEPKKEPEQTTAKPEKQHKAKTAEHHQSRSSASSKACKVPTKAQLKSMDLPSKHSTKRKKVKKAKKEKAETKAAVAAATPPDAKNEDANSVRRSSRIKSISVLKKSSKGRGLVKIKTSQEEGKMCRSKANMSDFDAASESSNSGHNDLERVPLPLDSPSCTSHNGDQDVKPVKVKSRWRRSSELEMGGTSPNPFGSKSSSPQTTSDMLDESSPSQTTVVKTSPNEEMELRLKQFVHLKENQYLTERLSCKEAKKMVCDCFLTDGEIERGEYGCGEDCLNRLLMIECGNLCVVGDRCTNKRFQKMEYSPCEVFITEKKGCGIRATANIPYGEFILEYVGEVLDSEEFDRRAKYYSEDKNKHYYFMALRADTVIDATQRGNISRFINHSCEPNAETQKWTVNGELRIGFFSTRTILAGEEITFDYQFQRYGKEAQKCYCEAPTCRGWIGEEPDDDEEDEEDDEEEEEEGEEQEAQEKGAEGIRKGATVDGEHVQKAAPVAKKKTYVRRKIIRKPRKEIFEDADLGEEIEMLCTTGLKNQAHTLKLSRLMVRAKEPTHRMQLLRLIRYGEFPCRRLFLDYHGLRLMHGWMGDIPTMSTANQLNEAFCLEMLQTLAVLPIPNKTMLQDSKVLHMVEKWSVLDKKPSESPSDSSSSSPNVEASAAIKEEKGAEKTETPKAQETATEETLATGEQGVVDMEIEVKTEEPPEPPPIPKKDYQGDIVHLAIKLLEEWLVLKEVFRIPKKERIEQMKEHEREADRGYKAGLGLEQEATSERKSNRYRSVDVRRIEKIDTERYRKGERSYLSMPRISKYERRKLFQMKVEQEEADRRRKQQEMWRQHEQNCMMMGTDPRFTAPYDPNRGYQCFWNPQTGQWQNFTPNAPNQPQMFIVPQPPPMVQHNTQYPMMQPPPPLSYQTVPAPQQMIALEKELEDPSQVKFMGPIPPPLKMPPRWKCAKDKYGRPYYYHIKLRKAQWEPPPDTPPLDEPQDADLLETSSSSESSSLSSDTSSDSEDEDDLDDTKLLLEIRQKLNLKKLEPNVKPTAIPSSALEDMLDDKETEEVVPETPPVTPQKRKREGLVQEIIISPRREEDRLQFKEDVKRYKETKEKLKRQKEQMLEQSRKIKTGKSSKQSTKASKRHKSSSKAKQKSSVPIDINSEAAKKIKETFRSSMAGVMVGFLNAYRKPDCKQGKITNTEDFKHLARKLTHFVMVKEMKHCNKDIQELVCTESVKSKAKEFVRKYMSKFGDVYIKPKDDLDNY